MEERCPCCVRHCFRSNLRCQRGINYFAAKDAADEIPVTCCTLIRQSANLLHHHPCSDERLLSIFCPDEQQLLQEYLTRALYAWRALKQQPEDQA